MTHEKAPIEGSLPQATARWVDEFMFYLKNERASSPYTLTNYAIDLRRYLNFVFERHAGHLEVQSLSDLKTIRDFLTAERKRYERTTVARRLSVIKSFLKFLHREGYLSKNVAKLIQLPRPYTKLPTILSAEQVVQLIEGVPEGTLRHKRVKAVLELLYSTGIRVSELVALHHDDIDFRNGTLRVWGKGSKERMVPMGRHCQKAIRDYIDAIPRDQKRGAKVPLFLNQEGARVTVRTIQRNLREFAVEILGPVGQAVTPHTFRHSCATHLLAAGAGLREIQELLGHRTLVTTQKYTQVDIERLKASYKKAHPKERKTETV